MFSIFPKDDKNQTLRIKRFLIALGSYVMWSTLGVFLHFQKDNRITFNVLIICLLGIIAVNILLYAIIRTGLNKRFKDPSMTLLQMGVATFWAMVVVYYADSFRSVVLILYLAVFMFGLFRLTVRQFLFLSVFAVVNYAAIILLLYKIHPESINNKTDVLNLVILAMVLAWFSLVGGYISSLRTKISKDRSTIEQMTNNIQDVIFVLDMNMNYTYVSPSVKILRGYEPEEVLKQALLDTITPSSLELAQSSLSEVMELEKIEHKEDIFRTLHLEIKRKDGTTVWTETKFSFIRNKNQQLVGILGVMRDITERKQAESQKEAAIGALRESEKYFKEITENSSDMIIITDKSGQIKYCSRSIERFTGYKPEELIGRIGITLIHPDDVKRALSDYGKVILSMDSAIPNSFRIMHKDGTERYFEGLGKNLLNNPTVEGFIMNVRDITDRKRAEEKLQYTLDSLRKAVSTTIQVMVSAVEMRDPYTYGHQIRSADIARAIATEMGLPEEKIDGIRMAGSIHDIGKLSIPAEILSKPTKLTDIEFSLIKEHCRSGYEMLKDVESPWPLAEIVYQHHERMNGSGYPQKIKGDEILLESRILAVADVVEAMASHRPYRAALGVEAALEEIKKNKGILYDHTVANACLKLFREKGYQLT